MRLLQNGLVETDCGRIAPRNSAATVEDLLCLQKLLNQTIAQTSFPGFFRGGAVAAGVGPGPGGGGTGERGPQGPAGPPGPSLDTHADTYTVNVTGEDADFTSIPEAIAALPDEGGDIYVREGTYDLAASIVLPDKDVKLVFGDGAVLNLGANAISAFTVPDGLTDIRKYTFVNLQVLGSSTVGQEVIHFLDSSGFGNVYMYQPDVQEVETFANYADYDQTYSRYTELYVYDGILVPTTLAGSSLLKCVNPAGTFAGSIQTHFYTVLGYDMQAPDFTRSWGNFDVDIDVQFVDCDMSIGQDASMDGLLIEGKAISFRGAVLGQVTSFGDSWGNKRDGIFWSVIFAANGTVIEFQGGHIGIIDSVMQNVGIRFTQTTPTVDDCWFFTTTLIAVHIELTSGAHSASISTTRFQNCTADLIRTAAPNGRYIGNRFQASGGTNTVDEDGTADFNLGVGNDGLSTGGGLALTGAGTRFTIGDYNFA
jgi:hypothetical protein